jgi:glutamine synthetase adenylyltransferase
MACPWPPPEDPTVKQLIAYLRNNLILDFQGDLTLEMVRDFLRDDDSREARALLAKLVEERGVSDMLITLADCLLEPIQKALTDDVLREQLRTYSES